MDRVKHMSFASALFILMVVFVSFPATFRCEQYQWYRFSPAPELLKSANSSFIPISFSDKYIMVYLQKHESGYLINTENFLLDSNLVLIDPKTGHETIGPMTFNNQGYWSLNRRTPTIGSRCAQ